MRTSVAQIFAFGLAASSAVSAHQVSGGRIAGFGLAVYAAPAVAAPLNNMMVALTNKARQVTSAPSTGGPDIYGDNGDDAQDEADDAKDDAQDRADDIADAADDAHDDFEDHIDAILDAFSDAADDGSVQKRKVTLPGNIQGATPENPSGTYTGDTSDGGPRDDGSWPNTNDTPPKGKANQVRKVNRPGNDQGATPKNPTGPSTGDTYDGGLGADGSKPGSNAVLPRVKANEVRTATLPGNIQGATPENPSGLHTGDMPDGGMRADGTWPLSNDVPSSVKATQVDTGSPSTATDASSGIISSSSGKAFESNIQGATPENPSGLATGATSDGGHLADGTFPLSNDVPPSVKATQAGTAASSTATDATTASGSTIAARADGLTTTDAPEDQAAEASADAADAQDDNEDDDDDCDDDEADSQDDDGDDDDDADDDDDDSQDDDEDDDDDSDDDVDDSQDDDEDDAADASTADASTTDASTTDASTTDASTADASTTDASTADASAPAPTEDPQPEDNGVGVISADHFMDPAWK